MKLLRFLTVCSLGVLVAVLSLWAGINAVNVVALLSHEVIGPGGGWSIAVGNLALSFALACWLVIATVVAHFRPIRNLIAGWPISKSHLWGLVAWVICVTVFSLLVALL